MNIQEVLPAEALQFLTQLAALCPPPTSIWLIGSRANGRHRPDSDTDLLVFSDQEFSSVVRASMDPPTNIDVLVVYDGDQYADVWHEKTGSLRELQWHQIGSTRATYTGLKFVADDAEEHLFPLPAKGAASQLGVLSELNESAVRIWPNDG